MADFNDVKDQIDLSAKTALVSFNQPHTGNPHNPSVLVMHVPWDVPGEQTETEIKNSAIENAKQILRQIS
jgi:hypothetical protein